MPASALSSVPGATRVLSQPLPAESRVARLYPRNDLADSYAIWLPPASAIDPELLAHAIFDRPAPWMRALMSVRDALVAPFGVRTARSLRRSTSASPAESARRAAGERIGIFRIHERNATEIVLGEDDRHLDFRVSVAIDPTEQKVTVSTVVHCHNRLGRLYLAVVGPVHRMLVPAMLRRAARAGWPRQNQS